MSTVPWCFLAHSGLRPVARLRRALLARLYLWPEVRHTAYSVQFWVMCYQLADLVYDGGFEVLQWLPSPSAVPPAQLLKAWCVTVKVLPDISAISALTAVKHGSYSSLTPPLRQQSVNSRIQPGSDVIVCAEMDEQWGYVGAKSRQRWLFYAYDRIRRTVVAHVFGERTLATLERLPGLLSAFEVVVWMTDDWPLYESRLKGELHDKVIGHYLNIKHYQ